LRWKRWFAKPFCNEGLTTAIDILYDECPDISTRIEQHKQETRSSVVQKPLNRGYRYEGRKDLSFLDRPRELQGGKEVLAAVCKAMTGEVEDDNVAFFYRVGERQKVYL